MKREKVLAVFVFLSGLMVLWMISCGGGGSSDSFEGTLNIGAKGQNIPLTADETWSRAFTVTFDVSRFGGPYTALVLDLQENLSNLTFAPQPPSNDLSGQVVPLGTTTGSVTLFVAPADAANACTDGEPYGPFTVTFDTSSQPQSISPPTLEASQTTIDIINVGAFSVCVQVTIPVTALASLGQLDVALCDEPIAAIAGTWFGPYSCGGNCPESGEVTLTITQDSEIPSRASYADDGGANYEGTVCGNSFSFEGGLAGAYTESGTFIMDPGGQTATKTSTYTEVFPGTCSGTCSDDLERVP